MHFHRFLLLSLTCAAVPASFFLAGCKCERPADEWISLFDGTSLAGWTPKVTGSTPGENPGNIFRVEDGTIRVSYDAFERFDNRFGHLFFDTPFSHYKLRLEYRFFGEQKEGGPGWAYLNSGVMLHGQSAASMQVDQNFPDSVEVQFLGSDASRQRPTANICTPGTKVDIAGQPLEKHCVDSSSPPMPADEWTEIEIVVNGSESMVLFVNGLEVLRATNLRLDDGTPLASGTISLQAEGHDCAYRNVRLLPLK